MPKAKFAPISADEEEGQDLWDDYPTKADKLNSALELAT
jgi:hypothetical protein